MASLQEIILEERQRREDRIREIVLAERARRGLPSLPRTSIEDDSGILSNIYSGLVSGATGLFESAALGAAAALEEDAELRSRRKIQAAGESIRESLGADEADEDSIAYKLSAGIGSIGALLPAAALGPAALPVAGAVAAAAGAGEASERARAFGATEDERGAAALRGTLIGATEITPLGKLAKAFQITPIQKVLDKLAPEDITDITSRVQRAGATSLAEGAQEAAAGILQNLNERGYNPTRELIDSGVLEEGLIGAGAGGILQALADVFIKGRARGVTPDDDDTFKETVDDIDLAGTDVITDKEIITEVDKKLREDPNVQKYFDEGRRLKEKFQSELGATETGDRTTGITGEAGDKEEVALSAAKTDDVGETTDVITKPAETDETGSGVGVPVTTKTPTGEAVTETAGVVGEGVEPARTDTDSFDAREGDIRPPLKPINLVEDKTPEDQPRMRDAGTGITERGTITYPETIPYGKEELKDTTDREKILSLVTTDPVGKRNKNAKGFFEQFERADDAFTAIAEYKIDESKFKESFPTFMDEDGKLITLKSKDDPTLITKEKVEAEPEKYDKTKIETPDPAFADKLAQVTYGKKKAKVTLEEFNNLSPDSTKRKELRRAIMEKFHSEEINPLRELEQKVIGGQGRAFKDAESWVNENLTNQGSKILQVRIDNAKKAKEAREAKEVTTKKIKTGVKAGPVFIPKDTAKGLEDSTKARKTIAKQPVTETKTKPLNEQLEEDRRDKTKAAIKAVNDASVALENANIKLDREKDPDKRQKLSTQAGAARRVLEKAEKTLSLYIPKGPLSRLTRTQLLQELKKIQKGIDDGTYEVADLGFGETDIDAQRTVVGYVARKLGTELDTPLSNPQMTAVAKNNLKGLLENISKNAKDKNVQDVAKALLKVAGDTKIRFGGTGAGSYVPSKDTIFINMNNQFGPTVQTVLHEMTHAATILNLQNKSHPVTRQLMNLYKQVKKDLDPNGAGASLEEFVAYSFAEPSFQKELADLHLREPVNPLEKFFRIVSNFVRRLLGKPAIRTMSELDMAIFSTLSADRNLRDTQAYFRLDPQETLNNLGRVQKTISKTAREASFGVRDAWNGLTRGLPQKIGLMLVGGQGMGDIAATQSTVLGNLAALQHETMEKMVGDSGKSDQEVREVVESVNNWAKQSGRAKKEALDKLIYHSEFGSTIYDVNPFLTKSEAIRQYTDDKGNLEFVEKGGETKIDIWNKQRKQVRIIGAGGKKAYQDMLNLYRRQLQRTIAEISTVTDKAMETTDKDGKVVANTEGISKVKKVFKEILDRANIDQYFPLTREGKYKLIYNVLTDKDGKALVDNKDAYVVRHFQTKAERDEIAKSLRADKTQFDNVRTSDGNLDQNTSFFENVPPSSFVAQVIDELRKANVDKTVEDQIIELFIDQLPETSFAKSMKRRKGVAGFQTDSIHALRSKAFDAGRQVVKLKYNRRLRDITNDIEAERKKILEDKPDKNEETLNAIVNDLAKRNEFARGVNIDSIQRLAAPINQGAFLYTLGFNISSAVVNLFQIPMFAFSILAPKYGALNTEKAIRDAYRTVMRIGLFNSPPLQVEKYFKITRTHDSNGVPVESFTIKEDTPKKLKEELNRLLPLLTVARDRGQLYQTNIADALGLDEAGRVSREGLVLRILNRTAAASAVMFNAGERLNRQVSLFAIYNLETQRMADEKKVRVEDLTPEELDGAAKESLYKTQEVNGGARLETGARISQNGLGRMAFMYKNYGLQMYYTMIKTFMQAINYKNLTAVERKIARNQLATLHLVPLLFAGVKGIPIYGAVKLLADIMMPDDEEDFDTLVRKNIGEGFYKGPLVAATGVDISDRIKLNELVFQENRFKDSFEDYGSTEEWIGYHFGGPALSTFKRLGRGGSDLFNGEIERGVEQITPPAVTNLYRNTFGRYAREGVRTRRGDPIFTEMTAADHITNAMGFAPKELTFRQELTRQEQNISDEIDRERTRLLKNNHIKRRMGDYEAWRENSKDIREFNKKVRRRFPKAVISFDTLDKSMKRHKQTTLEMHNGVRVSPIYKLAFERSRLQYMQGFDALFD